MEKPRILYLTVHNLPFKTMRIGLKDREYREPSKWIKSRLIDSKTGKEKEYDFICFRSGYHKKAPYFICVYKGFEVSKKNYSVNYKTEFKVDVKKGHYRILLGSIVNLGNTEMKELF